MNIQVKAATIVAGFVVSMVLGIGAVQLAFAYIPLNVLGTFGIIVIAGFALNLLYTIILDRLEYQQKLQQMVKK